MARHGENIHKRKDGRWEGRYIKSRTKEKRIVWGYLYGHTYAEVKESLLQKKAEYSFYNLNCPGITFAEFSMNYLHSLQHSVKESTYAHYQYTLLKYILPVLGSLAMTSLNEQILETGLDAIVFPNDNGHKPLGYASAKECLSMVRRICAYAARLHVIRPLTIVFRLPQKRNKAVAPLSSVEQQRLRDFVLADPTSRKLGVLFAMELGLRIGEICGLKWKDIDLKNNTVQISRTVSRISSGNGHTKVVVQSPKTSSSRRKLPLPLHLISVLKKLRQNHHDDDWFLSENAYKPVEPRCYRKSIRNYLKQARVQTVHPHMLRHTFATTCLQAGCDIKTLSELLGHTNAAITLQRYVHSDMGRKRKEIDRIFQGKKESIKSQHVYKIM